MTEKKILIIDDERNLRLLFQKHFGKRGYDVVTASDGKEGIEKLRNEHPDLVFLDLVMPEMDGIETLTHIREIDKDVVVVILTGYPPMDTALKGNYLNIYDYMTKPFDLNKLEKTIEKALAKKKI
jgi:DNA-binding NtrC family response regulator